KGGRGPVVGHRIRADHPVEERESPAGRRCGEGLGHRAVAVERRAAADLRRCETAVGGRRRCRAPDGRPARETVLEVAVGDATRRWSGHRETDRGAVRRARSGAGDRQRVRAWRGGARGDRQSRAATRRDRGRAQPGGCATWRAAHGQVTVSAEPLVRAVEIVEVPLWPWTKERLVGFALMEKSFGGGGAV